MELVYMQKALEWKEEYDEGEGMDIVRIEEEELFNNIQFPKAYKEFLELTGIDFYASPINTGYDDVNQKRAKELLKEYNLSHLIQKDFWVIGDTDISFYYIHFDEGDNPSVYRLTPEDYEEYPDESSFGKIADTFEAWVNKWITSFESEQALENS